jgi:carboxylesterase type B
MKNQDTTVKVQIIQGIVCGKKEKDVYTFKGIPYATPLKGLDRWMPPKSPNSFDSEFDATQYGEICPQYVATVPGWLLPKAGKALIFMMEDVNKHPQGENCLNLNIWTSELKPEKLLPVMVFIHGGGLSIGSGADPYFDGTNIAKQDVVYVNFNYRLGMMGFLTGDGLFEKDVLPGNRGFMDAVALLKWVKENISQFGGDSNNITIAGQSGGGTAAWALLASPQSKGLIHKAIIMSGPINMTPLKDQLKVTKDVLKKLKVPLGDNQALATVSDKKAKSTLLQTQLFMKFGDAYGEMSRTKLPTTGAYGTEFLPDDVLIALEKGAAKEVDIMIGSCKNDGRVGYLAMPIPNNWGVRILNYMINGMIAPTKKGRKEIVRKYKLAMPDTSSTLIQEQIQTDALYRIRALKAAEIHSKQKTGKTYVYQFNWESPVADGQLGALHALDVPFVLNNLKISEPIIGDIASAQPLATKISEAFVSFARTGTPTSASLPLWTEYNEKTRETMVFDVTSKMISDPDGELRKIWDTEKIEDL